MAHSTRTTKRRARPANGDLNRLAPQDRPVHDWYRFVLSFPPHLVRDYLDRFGVTSGQRVLDPFCGTGTTLVECRKQGIASVGVEAHPMACFASRVKVDWTPSPDALEADAQRLADGVREDLEREGVPDDAWMPLWQGRAREPRHLRTLPAEGMALLLADSISPRPLHKVLALLEAVDRRGAGEFRNHMRLALAKVLVFTASNLNFGPEVGVGVKREDAPVVSAWLDAVRAMAEDLRGVAGRPVPTAVHLADSRQAAEALGPRTVDAVITSPPYPNEKDYTRTTRLESVILGFIRSRADLRGLKAGLLRSNTRGVYKGDADDRWVADHAEIQRVADAIEARRKELGKTSGFERQYARVTRLYFGGMARHLASLRRALRPGARLAYVVGDQASYLRVMIRTGQILADIAGSLGYQVDGIDLFRTRLATATREQLREEVVVLHWPG